MMLFPRRSNSNDGRPTTHSEEEEEEIPTLDIIVVSPVSSSVFIFIPQCDAPRSIKVDGDENA